MATDDRDEHDGSNVIVLDEYRPHMAGEFICYHCLHAWVAVWDARMTELDCPECGRWTPVSMGSVDPD